MTLTAGDTLGPYRILGQLGAGGMGEIYRAEDPRLGREVAIKVLPTEIARSPLARARFEREARAIAALSHPNVLVIHDVGELGELRYVVTELLAGETLQARIARGRLPWREAVRLAVGIAEGLGAAHDRGVVHRDLKPGNVFLTAEGRVKILDFGLAVFTLGSFDAARTAAPDSTSPGTIVGTAGYMAPEQIEGVEIDRRADLFALGCLLYEMVTGEAAFGSGPFAKVMASVLRDEPPPLGVRGVEVPAPFEAVLRRLLRKNRDERFASAHDVVLALRATISSASASLAAPVEARAGVGDAVTGWWRRSRAGLRRLLHLPAPTRLRALAVLPFANASPDPELDYLTDGLTEGLIAALVRLEGLRVLARSTVFAYRGALDPLSIGAELGVDAVVIGRLVQRADRVTVTAELVATSSGVQLWHERLEGPGRDLVRLQDELAARLVTRLRRELAAKAPAVRRAPIPRPAPDPEAYRLYLRGRHAWNRRDEEGLRQARELFAAAIARDPMFAPAHAGLADALAVLPFYGLMAPREAFPRARAAADRARELDDELAEAHVSRAYVALYHDWDWPAAEAGFRRALLLAPGYATAHHWYGVALGLMGNYAAGQAELARAQEADPLAAQIGVDTALVAIWAGDLERAVATCRTILELHPDLAAAHLHLGLAREQEGEMGAAREAFARALELAPGSSSTLAALAHCQARAGEVPAARAALVTLEQRGRERYVAAYHRAVILVGLGERAAALAALREAHEQRSERLLWLRVDRRLRSLHRDPGYVDLLAEVGFSRWRSSAG